MSFNTPTAFLCQQSRLQHRTNSLIIYFSPRQLVFYLWTQFTLDSEEISYDQIFLKFHPASSLSLFPPQPGASFVHLSHPLSGLISLKCLMGLDHLFLLINEGLHWLVIVKDMGFRNSCSTLSPNLQMGGLSHCGPLQVRGTLTVCPLEVEKR